MDRLATMRSFALVVREGSFAGAARTLGIARANVTRHVADLEADLGVRLIERGTRAVRPSAAGAAYLPHCLDALAGVEAAAAVARGEAVRVGGRVRLSAPVAWGRAVLPGVLARLRAAHPGLSLDVMLSDRRVDLVREGVDVAVRIGEAPKSLRAVPLGDAALHVVAAPAYLAARGRPEHPSDLRDHDCILYALTAEPAVWRLGGRPVRVSGPLTVDNGDLAMAAVEAGLGLALQPDFVIRAARAAERCKTVLDDHSARPLPVAAIVPPGPLPAKTEAVLAALHQ